MEVRWGGTTQTGQRRPHVHVLQPWHDAQRQPAKDELKDVEL